MSGIRTLGWVGTGGRLVSGDSGRITRHSENAIHRTARCRTSVRMADHPRGALQRTGVTGQVEGCLAQVQFAASYGLSGQGPQTTIAHRPGGVALPFYPFSVDFAARISRTMVGLSLARRTHP